MMIDNGIQNHKFIAIFDCETTGLNPKEDRIIQLSVVRLNKQSMGVENEFSAYINPSGKWKMNPEAEKVHGITREFLQKSGEKLKDVAPKFLRFIEDCDFGGYNSNQFDIQFIRNEFLREGFEFSVQGRNCYDMLAIERRLKPCNLDAVFQRYLGHSMIDHGYKAHDSLSDVKATAEILREQMRTNNLTFQDDLDNWEENHLPVTDGTLFIKVETNDDHNLVHHLVFAFGKYRLHDIFKVMVDDPSYLTWWSKNIASNESREVARTYCKYWANKIKSL